MPRGDAAAAEAEEAEVEREAEAEAVVSGRRVKAAARSAQVPVASQAAGTSAPPHRKTHIRSSPALPAARRRSPAPGNANF